MFTDSFGVDLIFKAKANITGATSAAVVIKPPNSGKRERAAVEQTATISDFVNGEVTYRTQSGDFANAGIYKLQAVVYFGATRKLRSEVVTLEVKEGLK